MKTTVIHHSADYDGIFCREIAHKFLPDAELIGWDFADRPLTLKHDCDTLYVMDLPCDKPFGFDLTGLAMKDDEPVKEYRLGSFSTVNLIWIDHHKSSIESHPTNIPGYRIDGVAACRLVWQWFNRQIPINEGAILPAKKDFIDRKVSEPLAVRLAGEYDIWDHRGDGDLEFQFGLDSEEGLRWDWLLVEQPQYAQQIIAQGKCAMACYKKRDADIMRSRSFMVEFEGLKFLALNTARCNSNTFAALDKPETGHDALLGFFYNGKKFTLSFYHAAHRKEIDLSKIAVKYGGGGHKGACGCQMDKLPF